jgi:hypothetical protein
MTLWKSLIIDLWWAGVFCEAKGYREDSSKAGAMGGKDHGP